MGRGDVESNIFNERAEIFVFGHEIRLAVHFNEHAHFPLQVNVGGDDPFPRRARCFLARAGNSFAAQNRLRLFQIASRFSQRAFTIHHARVGFFAQLLD